MNTRHPAVISASVGIIFLAWAVIHFTTTEGPPRFDAGPHRALGEVLAREALKVHESGKRLILITRETDQFKAPAFEAQLAGFEETLAKAGVKITTRRLLKVDPLRLPAVPPGDFAELLRKADEKDVIVSLLGPPILDDTQVDRLGKKRPHVLAVCSGTVPQRVDLRQLFKWKLMEVAVVSRDTPVGHPGGGTQAEFDRMFTLVTAANLSDLPAVP